MGSVNAANLIKNPGFELGTIPNGYNQVPYATGWTAGCAGMWFGSPGSYVIGTPDLFDSQSPNCKYDIPSNKWNINRPVRYSGRRYVGFSGGTNQFNSNGGYDYGELCEANYTLTATNVPNATYQWSTGATTQSIFVAPSTVTTYGGAFPLLSYPTNFDCGQLFEFTDLTLPYGAAGAYCLRIPDAGPRCLGHPDLQLHQQCRRHRF